MSKRCCCPPLAMRENPGNVTVAAYDLETGYLVWTNGYGRGVWAGADNTIVVGIGSSIGTNADGHQYTTAPNGILTSIPGAYDFTPLSTVSGDLVDDSYYAIGYGATRLGGEIIVFESNPAAGIENPINTGFDQDSQCFVTDSRVIIFSKDFAGGTINSILDSSTVSLSADLINPTLGNVGYSVHNDKMSFINTSTNTFWLGEPFGSGLSDTGYSRTGVDVFHVADDGAMIGFEVSGTFPAPPRTLIKIPSPYTSDTTVVTGIATNSSNFKMVYDDDHILIGNSTSMSMYDGDLNLLWNISSHSGAFTSYPKLVKDGYAIMQFGSYNGTASSRRMMSVNLDTGSVKWDRQNVRISGGGGPSGIQRSYQSRGLMIDTANNRVICSNASVPIGTVISV